MKAIKISDEMYQELIKSKARLSLESGENHTINDAISSLYSRPEYIQDLDENKAEEFIKRSELIFEKSTYFVGPSRKGFPNQVGIYSLLRIGKDP